MLVISHLRRAGERVMEAMEALRVARSYRPGGGEAGAPAFPDHSRVGLGTPGGLGSTSGPGVGIGGEDPSYLMGSIVPKMAVQFQKEQFFTGGQGGV
jgi:hypothetical protein